MLSLGMAIKHHKNENKQNQLPYTGASVAAVAGNGITVRLWLTA